MSEPPSEYVFINISGEDIAHVVFDNLRDAARQNFEERGMKRRWRLRSPLYRKWATVSRLEQILRANELTFRRQQEKRKRA